MNENSLSEMLKKASKKLGTNPENLQNAAKNGKIDDLLNKMNTEESQKIKNILSNKQEVSKLLSTPKANQLLKKFLGEK